MAPVERKLWLFLNEALADTAIGNALLGTLVVDVQDPTNAYAPESSTSSREHPFLTESDKLKPSVETREKINLNNTKGSSFDIGLYTFISGNNSSKDTHQAALDSEKITTYRLQSATKVFDKIHNTQNYWNQVEALRERHPDRPLYFIRGYKVASNPDVRLESHQEGAWGGKGSLPLAETLGGVMGVPIAASTGDAYLKGSREKDSLASQSGTSTGDRLFAIEYWTMAKRREAIKSQKRRLGIVSRTRLVDDISSGISTGNHLKFSGNQDAAGKTASEEVQEEEANGFVEEGDQEDVSYDFDDIYDEDADDQDAWVLTKHVDVANLV